MKETADLAGKRDAEAKRKYKEVYDRKVTERDMQVGDLVLALEPTQNDKMQASYTGSYQVIEQITPVTYKLEVP